MNRANFTTEGVVCGLLSPATISSQGEFITEQEAAQRLQDYFTVTGTSPDDPKLIYGQLIGLDMLKAFMEKVDTYNSDPAITNPISAIRIYDAMSVRPYLPAPDNTKLLIDVLIMPVFEDSTDFFKIHPLVDPNIVLSSGMPCPNECHTGFYMK